MTTKWPMVKLNDVLRLDLDRVSVDSGRSYPMVGVLSFGRGLFDREPIEDGKTSYKYFYHLKANHIVMSQLFGWEGALALSSEKFAGKYLSPQFPTFITDETKLHREFLGWFIRRPIFWENLGSRASGMGDRRRTLNPEALFACEIPLPPLAEQQRIMAKIDQLATKIAEARSLRRQAAEEAEAFITAVHVSLAGGRFRKLGDILQLKEYGVPVRLDQQYPQVGMKGFGGGLFSKPAISGTQTTYRNFNRLFDGALVLSQVKGWEGAVAVCDSSFSGRFVSPEYRTFSCVAAEATPDYLATLARTQWFWGQLKHATRGVGARRERTRPEQFLSLVIPMPDVRRQTSGTNIFREVGALKRWQAETSAKLNALLPSILDKAFKGEL